MAAACWNAGKDQSGWRAEHVKAIELDPHVVHAGQLCHPAHLHAHMCMHVVWSARACKHACDRGRGPCRGMGLGVGCCPWSICVCTCACDWASGAAGAIHTHVRTRYDPSPTSVEAASFQPPRLPRSSTSSSLTRTVLAGEPNPVTPAGAGSMNPHLRKSMCMCVHACTCLCMLVRAYT